LGFTTSSVSGSPKKPAESITNGLTVSYGKLDKFVPPHLRQGPGNAPHWYLPDLDGPSATGSVNTSVDQTSVPDSGTTTGGKQGRAFSFNAWGPDGQYARKVKTPTVVSNSTRNERSPGQAKVGKTGWAKVVGNVSLRGPKNLRLTPSQPSRKQPPQLPDYLKYDLPFEDNGHFDGESDDDW
jgi:hypothetical protein